MKSTKPSLKKIHDIGVTIYPENTGDDPASEASEDFYGSDLDDSDDKYVNDNFRQGDKSTEAVLCCAMCFTPVCYQCKSVGDSFLSKSALNVYVDDVSSDSSGKRVKSGVADGLDSNKRKFEKDKGDSEKNVKCTECNNVVATLSPSNNYIFKNVIASQP